MSKFFCLLLIISFSQLSFSQQHFNQNELYVEMFGTPISIVSVNYERQLQSSPGFGLRAGIGYYGPGVDDNIFSIPIGINYLVRLKHHKRSFIQFATGVTWSSEEGFKNPPVGRYDTKDDYDNVFSYSIGAGFRQHLMRDKLMWRIDVSYIKNKYRGFLLPGLSVGYRF